LLPWRTAVENVALPLEIRGVPRRERLAAARESLADVGLADFADAYPAQLSHGMRQRTAVARTLSADPDILLMDEPFSALDAQTRLLLQGQFTTLWERIRPTVIFVTHDLGEAIALADRLIVMTSRPGKVKADLKVTLGRPRHVVDLQGNKDYHDLYQQVWNVFQTEVTAQAPPTGSSAAA
jgi:NitT/TauT family transport system ATP-binding protein